MFLQIFCQPKNTLVICFAGILPGSEVDMSFISDAWSCETLERGLGLVKGGVMSDDPDQAALQAELDRLQEPQLK